MINVLRNVFVLLILVGLPSFGQLLSGTRILSDSSAGAKMCLEELYTNGSAAACIQAPSSIASEFTWTLPNANPTSTTRCLEVTTSGVVQYAAAACGTGGGSTLPVTDTTSIAEGSADDTKEVRFEVDGITTGTVRVLTVPDANITLAGLNRIQTFTSQQTFSGGVILAGSFWPSVDSTWDIGSSTSLRFDQGWYDNVHTEELFFQRQAVGSHDFYMQNTTANIWTLWDASAGVVLQAASASSNLATDYDFYPLTSGTQELGLTSARWQKVWTTDLDVSGNTTLFVGTGNIYIRDIGTSTGVSCSGVSDAWIAISSDNYIVVCNGSGTRYRAALSSF